MPQPRLSQLFPPSSASRAHSLQALQSTTCRAANKPKPSKTTIPLLKFECQSCRLELLTFSICKDTHVTALHAEIKEPKPNSPSDPSKSNHMYSKLIPKHRTQEPHTHSSMKSYEICPGAKGHLLPAPSTRFASLRSWLLKGEHREKWLQDVATDPCCIPQLYDLR